MTSPTPPKEATRLTATEFLDAIVAGKTIKLADHTTFALADKRERHCLQFFLDDPAGKAIYLKPLEKGKEEVAISLLNWLSTPFKAPAIAVGATTTSKAIWKITRVEITQFGGLHPYCLKDGSTPPPLVIDVDRDVVLIRGQNGSGKSSIAKALTFVLTEMIPCTSQEPLRFGHADLVNHYTLPDKSLIELPTIVPMPTDSQWQTAQNIIETKVQITVKSDAGKEIIIARSVRKAKKIETTLVVDGKVSSERLENVLGISRLGLELSVLHMARLPFISFGKPEGLGKGVEELTGFRPIGQLAETSVATLSNYLTGAFTKKRENEQEDALKAFDTKAKQLAQVFEASPTKPPAAEPPGVGDECQKSLDAIAADLAQREATVKGAVAAAAGLDGSKMVLDGLPEKLVEARTVLQRWAGYRQTVAAAIQRLETIDATTIAEVREKVRALADRANSFAAQHADKKAFVRRRLYTLIGQWLKEHGVEGEPDTCPTCFRSLTEEQLDHDLGLPVAKALADAQKDNADLRFSFDQFVEQAVGEFKGSLPGLITGDLKNVPTLMSETLTADWAASISADIADSLKRATVLTALVELARSKLAAAATGWQKPNCSPLPAPHPDLAGTKVAKAVQYVSALTDVAEWARATSVVRATAVEEAYGVGSSEGTARVGSLMHGIDHLQLSLKDYGPVVHAKIQLNDLRTQLDNWKAAEATIEKARNAAVALDGLKALKRVVDVQVGGMLNILEGKTESILQTIYRPPGFGYNKLSIEHDGSALISNVEHGGVRGRAAQITNTSRQRAQLFAFILALMEYVWSRDGGVRLVLLDDPQSIFDETNQKKFAGGLVKLVAKGFQPFVLTFDRVFASRLAREGKLSHPNAISKRIARWELISRDHDYGLLALDVHEDHIIIIREEWRSNKTKERLIKEFCRETRGFVEKTLVNILDEAKDPVFDHPTLQPLMERLRRLSQNQSLPHSYEPFKKLLSLLPDGGPEKADLADALNWSCHFQAEELQAFHGEVLDAFLETFIPDRERCLDILHFWPGHFPVPESNLIQLPVTPAPATKIRLVGKLAASSGDTTGTDEPDLDDEHLKFDPAKHSTFVVGNAPCGLPTPVGPGTVLIVEPLQGNPDRHDIVLVWDLENGEAKAGWCKLNAKEDRLMLTGFAGGFQRIYRLSATEIRRVIGGLFAAAPAPKSLIVAIDMPDLNKRKLWAVEVTAGDSAEPLIRQNDCALVGQPIPLDDLKPEAAPAFAFRLSDGSQVLKRLDNKGAIPGHYLLLPLGMQGTGVLAAIGKSTADAPEIMSANPLVGFWRR